MARRPQASLDHQLAQRLVADPDAVLLFKLLGGEGRTEIWVVLAHQRDRSFGLRWRQATVARPTTLARHQTFRASLTHRGQHPEHLPPRHAQQHRRILRAQLAPANTLQRVEP